MPAVPRIARAVPQGEITRPAEGIAVVARLRWAHGRDEDVPAVAVAWTREAVEIRWQSLDDVRTDWIPAADVRRHLDDPVDDSQRPPSSRGQLKKNRW
jgi:hypothetical protein